MASLSITPVPCLRDNYAYAIVEDSRAWIVDPSEATPVLQFLEQEKLGLMGILATHHHHDHVGGIVELVDRAPRVEELQPWVAAHAHDAHRIPGLTAPIDVDIATFEPTPLRIGSRVLYARRIPGHTLGAIAWLFRDADDTHVFTGDTLFAAGCGRLFEGTPAQMYASLQALAELPQGTQLWFGHEYTAANLRFAAVAEPNNTSITNRLATLPSCTTPTTVELERATNPFVRARDADHLGDLRRHKDTFRG